MVLFTWRWQPHWRYVKHLVESGFIGRCYHAEFQFLSSFALDSGYKWRFDGKRSNGITGDLGSHMIDFAQWYLGDVRSVSADLPTFIDQINDGRSLAKSGKRRRDADPRVCQRRACGRVSVSRLGDEVVRIIASLHGEEGTSEVRHTYFGIDAGVVIRCVRKGEPSFTRLEVPAEFLEGGVSPTQLFDPYLKQSAGPRAFVDAILSDTKPTPGFDVGVRVQEVVDAALRSNAERRS